jgi:hypothetical protein
VKPAARTTPNANHASDILAFSSFPIPADRMHQRPAPGIGNPLVAAMLWLMIGLLVSVGALLFVAAGVARHIWLQRTELRKGTRGGNKSNDSADDADSELEL